MPREGTQALEAQGEVRSPKEGRQIGSRSRRSRQEGWGELRKYRGTGLPPEGLMGWKLA